MHMIRREVVILLFAVCICACSGNRPEHLGKVNSSLPPCPDTPNCVHSQMDTPHSIAPITLKKGDDITTLKKIITREPAATLIVDNPDYLYAEYQSKLFGFIDDVEFIRIERTSTVHIRSASRIGRSDFGVNRRRIEALRVQYLSSTEE